MRIWREMVFRKCMEDCGWLCYCNYSFDKNDFAVALKEYQEIKFNEDKREVMRLGCMLMNEKVVDKTLSYVILSWMNSILFGNHSCSS